MKQVALVLYNLWFFIFIGSLSSHISHAQVADFVKIKKNIKGSKLVSNPAYTTLKSTINGNFIYTTPSKSGASKRIIHRFNTTTEMMDSIVIERSKKNEIFFNDRILSMTIVASKFVFLGSNYLFVFEESEKNELKYVYSIKNDYGFMNCQKLGGNLFLQVAYNYHPVDYKHTNVWAILNLEKGIVEKTHFLTDDNNALFGFLVNQWVSVHSNKICYAHTDEYFITIHDENFNQIDQIKTNEFNENKSTVNRIKANFNYSKDYFVKMRGIDEDSLTRIRKVFFLKEDLILALIKMAGKDQIRADYWLKQDHGWQLAFQDSSTIWFQEGVEYSLTKNTYSDFYQNVFDLIYAENNKFYLPYFPYIPTIATDKFDRERDYYDKQNYAIETNETYLGIKEIGLNQF
jgi:hypothetical protein